MIRLASGPEGALAVGRHLPGRGAWLCRATPESCFDAALRSGGFARALRVGIDRELANLARTDVLLAAASLAAGEAATS